MKLKNKMTIFFLFFGLSANAQNTAWSTSANIGIGTTTAPTSPTKLNLTSGTAGVSGLRFGNLNSSTTTSANTTNKLLTVNANGDVILANDVNANFYNSDGILTSNRLVTLTEGYHLNFTDGTGDFGLWFKDNRAINMVGDGGVLVHSSGATNISSGYILGLSGADGVRVTSQIGDFKVTLNDLNNTLKLDEIKLSTPKRIYIGTEDVNTNSYISNYALAVRGAAVFESATVRLYSNWPDYVFNKDYKLMPLDKLENFINVNNHLPEVPPANEMAVNGINVELSTVMLMKKVEELTLYIIEQNKKIEALQKKISHIVEK